MATKYFIVDKNTGTETPVEYRGGIESRKEDALFLPENFKGSLEDGMFTDDEALKNGVFFLNANKDGAFAREDSTQLDETGQYDIIEKDVPDEDTAVADTTTAADTTETADSSEEQAG